MNDIPEITTNGDPSELETLDYLRGVKSSTCLLLPTTPMDFKHPLSEDVAATPFLTLNDESNMEIQSSDACAGDSSSSGDSNSVVQDPVSAQLINKISMLDYQTLSKNGDIIVGQVEDCKLNGNLNLGNRKLPNFVNWNWGLIRKFLFWVVLSGLVACLAAIIAMIVTIPKECNPDLPWHQGKVFYEIFPASFEDYDGDGTGDLKGLIQKLDYISDLNVAAIRLNSIFKASHYPEQYYKITSLLDIDPSIGTMKDFQNLINIIHGKGMALILDIPVMSMANALSNSNATRFSTDNETKHFDETSEAIQYWARGQKVDGFYLKGLEKFIDDVNLGTSLRVWKNLIGYDKILIASENAFSKAAGDNLNMLLSRIDLIDINLDLQKGIKGLKDHIDNIISGSLWSKPNYPWVHWNIGNIDSERIASKHINNTLTMTVLEFILPGTINIFYGDEIGLGGVSTLDIEEDFPEHAHVHNLVPMSFSSNDKKPKSHILPWNSKSVLPPSYDFLDVVKNLTKIRLNTPTIYLRGIYKDGNLLKNIDLRKTEENLIVIERWYPRRNTCVFVGNLSNKSITTDLSLMFYGGTVVAGTNSSLIGQVLYFDQVTFPPNSAIILKLEK